MPAQRMAQGLRISALVFEAAMVAEHAPLDRGVLPAGERQWWSMSYSLALALCTV